MVVGWFRGGRKDGLSVAFIEDESLPVEPRTPRRATPRGIFTGKMRGFWVIGSAWERNDRDALARNPKRQRGEPARGGAPGR